MQNQDIECPKCGHEFAITEALARPIVEAERNRLELEIRQRSTALAAQEEQLRRKRQQLDDEQKKQHAATAGAQLELQKKTTALDHEKRQLELTVSRQLDQEREGIRREAMIQEQTHSQVALAAKDGSLAELTAQLAESRRVELEARKLRVELDEEKELFDLELVRRVDEQRDRIREETLRQEEGRNHLKLAERDKVIDDMRKQVEELRRRIEQGPQQRQGEVQELELERILRGQFPGDEFEPVAVGRAGGDLIQKVIGPGGADCGTILWESKRTKEWKDPWLSRVRENQRNAHATLSVIASTTLRRGIVNFDCVDDVWISSFDCIIPLAKALRATLIQTKLARVTEQDRSGKTERIYSYVTGQEFKHRVSSIVEAYVALQKELEKEKRLAAASWGLRAKYHDQIMNGVEGMRGELHGIVGESMPGIDCLEAVQLDREPISLPIAELTPLQPKELAAD